MDIDAIALGEDFVKAIETTVAECDVLIAIIGANWLTSKDDQGDRRLDNPEDFVRMEIGTALGRGIRVIPVLVDGALMPRSTELPDNLKPLVRRNALRISDTSFDGDCQRLVAAIKQILEKAASEELEGEKNRSGPERGERKEEERPEAGQLQREVNERQAAERRQQEERQRLQVAGREKQRLEAEQREQKGLLEARRREREEKKRPEKSGRGNEANERLEAGGRRREEQEQPKDQSKALAPSPGWALPLRGKKELRLAAIILTLLGLAIVLGVLNVIYFGSPHPSPKPTTSEPMAQPSVSVRTPVAVIVPSPSPKPPKQEVAGQSSAMPAAPVRAARLYVFGVVAKSNNNPVFQVAKTGAVDEAKKLSQEKAANIKIDWRTPSEEDPQKQADAIEKLVYAGASGIAVSCSDANELTDAINKAVDSGVPVVCFDSDAPLSKRFAYFGSDDLDWGKRIMEQLAMVMGGKGVVAILAGNQNAPNLQKRVQGVRKEAKKYPDIKILDAFYHKETPQAAAAKVEQVMQAHPETTGWAMIGAWPLFTDNALKFAPGTIKVVAADALPQELDYVRSGYVQVLLTQQYYEWGTKSVDMLYDKVVVNKNPPSSFVKGELIPVTKDNVEEYAKYWEKWLPHYSETR